MSYDVKCYDLAKAFLQDHHADDDEIIGLLAEEIQETIDLFIQYEVNRAD